MSIKPIINVSVRNLVEYVMQEGDISFVFFKQSRMTEGTKAHQKVQNSRGKDYKKEVTISSTIDRKGCILNIKGRIDGILEKDKITYIEEIKSTTQKLELLKNESNPKYWAQAKIYAYLYCKQNKIKSVGVQLTYFNIESQKTRFFSEIFELKHLETFCLEIIDKYLNWASTLGNWLITRRKSIGSLDFPFPQFRKGQENLIKVASETIKKQSKLFCQAPTGIGKTIATTYPAVKLMGEDFDSKIFYLTAKTTTRFIAEETLDIMRKTGLKLKSVTITAKAKICFKKDVICDPSYCEYAKGHFNRINDAIQDIYEEDAFTQQAIEKYAQKHKVCPFEFSLDLSNWSDCVICDYNYVFDPRVYLRRFFFEEKGDFVFLVDEAHNLVDRAREMFSAVLTKKTILKLSRQTKEQSPELSTVLKKMNQYMISFRKLCEQNGNYFHVQAEMPNKEFLKTLRRFNRKAEDWLELNKPSDFNEDLLELYFDVRNFLRVSEDYNHQFITYFRKYGGEVVVKLFCIDPSKLLRNALNRGKSAVFFSATLTPLDYFSQLLGGDNMSTKMALPSPFPEENLCLMVADRISTRYRDRLFSYDEVAEIINHVVQGKIGNYLVFFPSYEYMEEVLLEYEKLETNEEIIVQETGMTEKAREQFLGRFSDFGEKTLVGFVVMGGIFGEGIDLIGEKLSGAVVVGVGLPKIGLERDLIKGHFDRVNQKGFFYAYTYPGMNKVLQAAGRVIRTENDRGVVILIGDRYSTNTYKKLIPASWNSITRITSKENLLHRIKHFWNNGA